MSLLYDRLEAGKLARLGKNIKAALSDDIHLNKIGCHYIGCVMYATLLGKSPVGATGTVKNIWGQPLVDLSPAQAKVLQDLAWESVSANASK
jgi:hypothetical protein